MKTKPKTLNDLKFQKFLEGKRKQLEAQFLRDLHHSSNAFKGRVTSGSFYEIDGQREVVGYEDLGDGKGMRTIYSP